MSEEDQSLRSENPWEGTNHYWQIGDELISWEEEDVTCVVCGGEVELSSGTHCNDCLLEIGEG